MTQNDQLAAAAKLAEKSAGALSVLQNQIAVLEKENAFLRAQIIQFGIDAAASSGSQSSAGGSRQLLNSPLAQSLLSSVSQSPQVASAININGATSASTPPAISSSPSSSVGQGQQTTTTQLAAQQLLISLAQSLTNSPLLTSQSPSTSSSPLTQPITTSPASAQLSMSHLSAVPAMAPVTPSRLTTPPAQQLSATVTSAPPTPQPPPPPPPTQQQQQQQALFNASSATVSLPSAPVLGSLVQTLASLAGTNTTASPSPLPKAALSPAVGVAVANAQPSQSSTGGGLSAAAAASLLNTLILAQSVLTGGGGGAGGVANPAVSGQGGSLLGDSSSVLSSIGLESVATGDHTTQ